MNAAKAGSQPARVVRHTAARVGVEILNKGAQFLFLIYLARALGTREYGVYTFVLSWSTLFVLMIEVGIHPILTRELAAAKERAPRIFTSALLSKLGLAAAMALLFAVSLRYAVPSVYDKGALWLALSGLVLFSFADLGFGVFRAYHRVDLESWMNAGNRLIAVAAGTLALLLSWGVTGVLATAAAANALTLAAGLFISLKLVGGLARPEPGDVSSLLKASLPLGLADLFLVLYFRIDAVMLGYMLGEEAAGLYGAAHRGIEAFMFIPSLVMAILLPVFVERYKEGAGRLGAAFKRALRLLLAFVLPIAATLSLLAEPIVLAVYGEEYRAAAGALRVMAWSLVLIYVNFGLKQLLVVVGRQAGIAWAAGMAALANLFVNLLLIPRYGIAGAAFATFFSELVLAFVSYAMLGRTLPGLALGREALRPLVAAGAMVGTFGVFQDFTLLALPAALAAFALVLFVLQGVTRDDLRLVIHALLPGRGAAGR